MSYIYTQDLVSIALTYTAYRRGIDDMLAVAAINADAEKMRPYVLNNVALMDRYDEGVVHEELLSALAAAPATTWLVITEGWCGDAAFNIPMMAAIEQASAGKVKLRMVLRDSNTELMDAHLTNGGKSIPKLIVLSDKLQELAVWGPRPRPLQLLYEQWKSEGLTLKDLISRIQQWYDEDNTRELQKELKEMIINYTGA